MKKKADFSMPADVAIELYKNKLRVSVKKRLNTRKQKPVKKVNDSDVNKKYQLGFPLSIVPNSERWTAVQASEVYNLLPKINELQRHTHKTIRDSAESRETLYRGTTNSFSAGGE